MKNITYINAGAGSGKTYTLTHKLAELLQNGDCAPSEVILTTFTELAASEFRQKARASLYEAKRPDIAAQLDAALIGTVHSVALRFVQKYWYLLGNSPEPKVMTDDDMATYISQSLAAHLTPERVDFFEQYTSYFGIDAPDFWRGELNSIIEQVNNYGIDRNIASVHVEVDDDMTAKDIQRLERTISYLCFDKYQTIMTVGVYAKHEETEESRRVKAVIDDVVKGFPEVIQVHGFYIDEETATVNFDVIISLDSKDERGIYKQIHDILHEKLPDYHVHIVLDRDYSLT